MRGVVVSAGAVVESMAGLVRVLTLIYNLEMGLRMMVVASSGAWS